MTTRRVLVLTSSTGSGHDMRAHAFNAWAKHIYGDEIAVRIEQIIENSSWLGRFGVWIYNSIHRHCPFLHNLYFFIVELFVSSHSGAVSFGGKYYRRLIEDFQPDVILSVHDSTNRGYFEDARRVLKKPVRCVTYCGEFSGGYGYSRNWVNPTADHFIARTETARQHALKLGIAEEKSSVFHKFLPPHAFKKTIPENEKGMFRKQLGLEADTFTVFLATGGFGANHHQVFLKQLLPLAGKVQVIAVCGRNPRIYEQVRLWSQAHPDMKLYLEGYSSRIAEFLQISDAVVTRGGANTTMEALHFNCPVLYDSLGSLMPQERCTVRYFLTKGAARLIRRPGDLSRFVLDWAESESSYAAIQSNLANLQVQEDPCDLIRLIVGDARTAL